MQKTLGENRVRIDFNVAGSGTVDQIKKKAAELIDLVNAVPMPVFKVNDVVSPGEFHRLRSMALTEIEAGAMWAVKAATF